MKGVLAAFMAGLLPAVFLLLGIQPSRADSATWNLDPATNDWNTATNWTPATVPNSTTDIATFGASNTTRVLTSVNVDLASIVFTAGAPFYTIDTGRFTLTFWGEGVRNDSGVQQTFTGGFSFNGTSTAGDNVTYDSGRLSFNDNASAGSALFGEVGIDLFDNASADQGIFTNAGIIFHNNSTAANGTFTAGLGENGAGGQVTFLDTASAGDANFSIFKKGTLIVQGGTLSHATVTANGGAPAGFDTTISIQLSATADHATLIANGGVVPGTTSTKGNIFFSSGSTAAEATIVINPTTVAGAAGGSVDFFSGASAANSNITVNGAAVTGSIAEAVLTFSGGQNTTAANATIVATGGSNGGNGGLLQFLPNAGGGTCRIELLGNSRLDMARNRDVDLTIGSLEGEGTVTVSGHTGGNALNIGSNDLSTTFSGLIEDGLLAGAISKIGTGTFTLSEANTYSGGTTVTSGILFVSNVSGSGTGTGAVSVNAGTLGGSGIIAGAVTVGTNTGVQAFLAPSKGIKKPATLTIQGALALNDDSTYIYKLKTKHAKADEVIANGVTIDSGAKFSFLPTGTTALTVGQIFTVISNTAATPISGTFHNLSDGEILTVNSNTFQADYQGGDGNDLTLTVVP
jgi:autotransporter-associated beta strand protein